MLSVSRSCLAHGRKTDAAGKGVCGAVRAWGGLCARIGDGLSLLRSGGRQTHGQAARFVPVFSAGEGRGGGRKKASLPADRHLLDKTMSARGGTPLAERLAEGQRPSWAAFGPASVPEKEAPRWAFISSILCNLTLIRCRSTFFPSRTCVGRRRVCAS